MKFHIVGTNETISNILELYDISIDELKKENKHIRGWNQLIPGTKLKVPVITKNMNEELNYCEPFIEDYYPKLKVDEEEVKQFENDEVDNSQYIENKNLIINEEKIDNDNGLEEMIKDNKSINHIRRPVKTNRIYYYPFIPVYYYVLPKQKRK